MLQSSNSCSSFCHTIMITFLSGWVGALFCHVYRSAAVSWWCSWRSTPTVRNRILCSRPRPGSTTSVWCCVALHVPPPWRSSRRRSRRSLPVYRCFTYDPIRWCSKSTSSFRGHTGTQGGADLRIQLLIKYRVATGPEKSWNSSFDFFRPWIRTLVLTVEKECVWSWKSQPMMKVFLWCNLCKVEKLSVVLASMMAQVDFAVVYKLADHKRYWNRSCFSGI